MENFELVSTILGILLAVIGFFLVRLLQSFDKLSESHQDFRSDFTTKLALLEKDVSNSTANSKRVEDILSSFETMKRDIEMAVQFAKEHSVVKDELAVIKRDQTAIWKRIDELKDLTSEHEAHMGILRERSHSFANKMMILKGKAEKAGWEFQSEWDFDSIGKSRK